MTNMGLFLFFCIPTDSYMSTIYWRCFLFTIVFFLLFLSKIKCPYVCSFISESFNSVFLINLPVSVPIPCNFYHYFSVAHLEVRKVITLEVILLFSQSWIFLFFPYEIENWSLHAFEELCWDFDGDCVESVDCFW